ncbi:hypothetical protein QA596_04940 [Balneolales bacterium ANBcel1]|nr:hypothetical protein [Balneolales bacterium ANBcel1]
MFKNLNCIAFFLLLWLITGCSTTNTVHRDSPASAIDEINELSQTREARIRKTDRTLFMGTDLSIRKDTVRWNEMDTEQAKELPLDEVAQIQIIDRNKGARRGLIYGLAAAVAGAAYGYFSYSEEAAEGSMIDFGADGSALLIGSVVAIPGVVGGLVIGAGRGYLITFHFEERNMPEATDQK